jgi:hypothetical protein
MGLSQWLLHNLLLPMLVSFPRSSTASFPQAKEMKSDELIRSEEAVVVAL